MAQKILLSQKMTVWGKESASKFSNLEIISNKISKSFWESYKTKY